MAGCNGGEVREARCRFPRPRPAIQLAPRETGARQRLERRLRRTVEHVLWSCLSALSAHWASIGFPLRRHSGFVAALFEPKDNAGGAAARADSTSTRSGHHVMATAVVPAHQIGLDGPLTEHHRHRILNVSRRDVAMRVHLRQGLDQSFFQGVCHCRLNMIAHGTLGKGAGLSSTGVNEHPERPPTGLPRAFSRAQTPARHFSLDNFVGLTIAPRILRAAAGKGNHIGSVVIHAQQFDRRSLVRKSVDDELRDPVIQRGQVLAPVAWKMKLSPKSARSLAQTPLPFLAGDKRRLENPTLLNRSALPARP